MQFITDVYVAASLSSYRCQYVFAFDYAHCTYRLKRALSQQRQRTRVILVHCQNVQPADWRLVAALVKTCC